MALTNDTRKEMGRDDRGKKSSLTVRLSLLSSLFCKDVGWSDLNLLIRLRCHGGCTLTSTIETCYHSICCEFATSFLHRLLFCPFTWVPQLRLPFVPEAHVEPVVCVIPLIHYWSAPRGVSAAFWVLLIRKCLHLACCSSTERLDRQEPHVTG